jgi:hypothetical protein
MSELPAPCLGDKARDIVTGFSGVVTAQTRYLSGHVRVAIQSESLDRDGKAIEPEWFDIEQVVVIGKGYCLPSNAAAA